MIDDKWIAFNKLKFYCEKENFKGWDPYDGLNSTLFQATPLKRWPLARLAWIQLFKRNPINLRNVVGIPKSYNPKGLGLFLTAYCNLYKINPLQHYLNKINFLANRIIELQTDGYSGACWGYDFPWESRAFYLPKYTPTVVVTSFVAESLLNAYDVTKNGDYLTIALSSANFILKDLNKIRKQNGFMFSYSPKDNRAVYNATLLGTRTLAKIYNYTKNEDHKNAAYLSALAVANTQHENGAFPHSEQVGDNWRDNFHTGFKLESLMVYQKQCNDKSFSEHIEKGFEYWINNFFLDDGTPKYFDSSTFPIDIHCPSQYFSTVYNLDKFNELIKLSEKIYSWTIDNMQDKEKGYFYYQITKIYRNKIPYTRWSQAWALYGLSFWYLYLNSR